MGIEGHHHAWSRAAPRFDWRLSFGHSERVAADEELFVLARGLGRVRLQLGLALVALGRDHRELGFRSLAAYARERLSRTKGWASESRAVASRLSELPAMFAALWHGRLSWCAAALLSRFASPEDEAELLEATAGMSVRELREALRERGHDPDEPEERFVSLRLSLPSEDAMWLQRGRWLIEALEGAGASEWFELLLAEGDMSLLEVMREVPGWHNAPEDVVADQARWLAAQERGRADGARREAAAAARLPPSRVEAGDAPDLVALPQSPKALDGVLRALCAALDSRELYFGELAERVFFERGWSPLGYASEEQYCRERLGMSAGLVRSRMRLAREARRLPALGEALRAGRLGLESALLVARVANGSTVDAWIGRAERRTFKHLREEVQAVELDARLSGVARSPLPPDDETLEGIWQVERDTLSGASLRALIGQLESVPHRDAVLAIVEGVDEARRVCELGERAAGAEGEGVLGERAAEARRACELGERAAGAEGEGRVVGGADAAIFSENRELCRMFGRSGVASRAASGADEVVGAALCADEAGSASASIANEVTGSACASGAATISSTDREVCRMFDRSRVLSRAVSGADVVVGSASASSADALAGLACASGADELAGSACASGADEVTGSANGPAVASISPVDREVYGMLERSAAASSAEMASVPATGAPNALEVPVVAEMPRDVDAHRMFGRTEGDGSEGAPSDASGSCVRSGACEGAASSERAGGRRLGYSTVEIRCREDVALHFRQLEASYERSGLPGSFLRFAVTALCHVALPVVSRGGGKYREVHVRDRLCCSSPVCDSRNVTCHHVVYRAHQGGDALQNLTSPCEFCHLEGEHGGRLRVRGRAPDKLRWEIGRDPLLVVEGRELRGTVG